MNKPRIGLVENDRALTEQLFDVSANRQDLHFSVYSTISAIQTRPNLLIVDTPELNPRRGRDAHLRFVEFCEILLDRNRTTKVFLNQESSLFDWRNQTVLILPGRDRFQYYYTECDLGTSAELAASQRIIHDLESSWPIIYYDHVTLSDIVDRHISKSAFYEIVADASGVAEFSTLDKSKLHSLDLNDRSTLAILSEVTESLARLAERVRGDNSILGDMLKRQILSSVDVIRAELDAPIIDRVAIQGKSRRLYDAGQSLSRATKEAGSISDAISRVVGLVNKLLALIF